jgi:hypothetical protein
MIGEEARNKRKVLNLQSNQSSIRSMTNWGGNVVIFRQGEVDKSQVSMVAPPATCCAREWCGGVISIWQHEVDESQMLDGVTPGPLLVMAMDTLLLSSWLCSSNLFIVSLIGCF